MADGGVDRPNQAAPVTLQQLREALAFVTDQYSAVADGTKNVFVWLWEAIQGDFNEQRTTGQIAFDTAVSMIPGVDQVCDVRDIIASCKQINKDSSDTWAWVGLVLCLIGLIPTVGSLLKGVLKIFFLYVRRFGLNHVARAVDEAMDWVITFLRRREVMKYWKSLKWDRLFHELANQTRIVRALVSPKILLDAFDRAISLMDNLLGFVKNIPFIGPAAQDTIKLVKDVKALATKKISAHTAPALKILDEIIRRLEIEDLVQRRGVLDAGNVHFTGTLPEARAVTLMRQASPPPRWLSTGNISRNTPIAPKDVRAQVDQASNDHDYPKLTNSQIRSFSTLEAVELNGPLKLYRVVSPSNFAASADWMSEDVFKKIMRSDDPKSDWRKFHAVWPDWNPNGQFVIYELKRGEKLKVWRGKSAAQEKDELPGHHLEGGYEQIKFDSSALFDEEGRSLRSSTDTIKTAKDSSIYYEAHPRTGALTPSPMTYDAWKDLPAHEQARYQSLRTEINHPKIVGPFDTNWGTKDFDSQSNDVRLGLPYLPGQITRS
ncbi:hypothetical protein [Stenotrophomonas sp. Marseille-Q5258]|uniref:hypothetical protein n=1 Tax=Stenotrophomonas TaxID=40323 RepID=UPI0021C8C6EF|nr:hypothetical protein [Stenotrophomonas sp. Marseille-Q5258]